MRKTREILKLKWHYGLGNRQIATSCNVSLSTISHLIQRATYAGVSWPSVQGMTDRPWKNCSMLTSAQKASSCNAGLAGDPQRPVSAKGNLEAPVVRIQGNQTR
jgi:hypothetical protein